MFFNQILNISIIIVFVYIMYTHLAHLLTDKADHTRLLAPLFRPHPLSMDI